MKILITGGAGFIGSAVVRRAIRDGHQVVNLDALTYSANLENVEGVAGDPNYAFEHVDICDRVKVEAVFATHRPDAVMHLAAESHNDRAIEGPLDFVKSNIMGTAILLEVARAHWNQLDGERRDAFRFHHISTDEVFGALGEDGDFTEETPYDPRSPYSASKAASDHLVRAWGHTYKFPVVITNCSNNYGPYQFPEKLIPLMILNALEGKPLPIYGDGRNVRDWLYVEDHCAGILLALERGQPGQKYNLGGFGERANIEIVDALCAELERIHPAARNPALARAGVAGYADLKRFVTDRPGHDRRYAIDSARAQKELGWQPAHDLGSGLAATVRWYLDHRDWCEEVQSGRYRRERLGLAHDEGETR